MCLAPGIFYRSSFSLPILSEINEELQKVLGRVNCVGCGRRYSIAVHFFHFLSEIYEKLQKIVGRGNCVGCGRS